MADLLSPNSTEAKLITFLRGCAGRAMRWGEHDCGLWLADWLVAWLGVQDPAAHLRGRYKTELECDDLIWPTPFPVLVGRLVRSCGLRSTREPGPGAVAVVVAPTGEPTGAIRTVGGGWALLVAHGFVRVPDGLRVICAWEPPPCPN